MPHGCSNPWQCSLPLLVSAWLLPYCFLADCVRRAEAMAVDNPVECGTPIDAGPADSVYALCSLLFPDAALLFQFLGTYLPDAGLRKQLQVSA
jgi:hypothetical protein